MELKEIIKRNYEATVKRGQITSKTTFDDFVAKTDEEVQELVNSYFRKEHDPFDPKEAIDVILVQTAMLHHYGFDVEKLLTEKMLFNEQRPD